VIVTLTTARPGSGSTTAAVGLAAVWPRPVLLVEADPCGYSPILAGTLAASVPAGPGVLDAAMAARAGRICEDLPAMLVDLPGTRARVLPGLASPAQRGALSGALWLDFADALRGWAAADGTDLLLDTGPLTGSGHPAALHAAADLVCLVTRPDLVGVSSARNWADELAAAMPDPSRLRLLVAGAHRSYTAHQVASYLRLPLLADLGDDPAAAAHYSGGEPLPRRHRGPLGRSLPAAAAAVLALDPDREAADA
jgi:hypothetical protein